MVGDALNKDYKSVRNNLPIQNSSNDIALQFSPEGGSLVYGLPSKVAFKAIGIDGLGVAVVGYIQDQDGNRVTELNTEHTGMGAFTLSPEKGNVYAAVFQTKEGRENRSKLPQPMDQGYVLSLNNTNKASLTVKVFTSAELVNEKELIMIAHCNGRVEYVSKIKADKQVGMLNVPKKYFHGGLVHFTLFSNDYVPVAERLVFIATRDSISASLKSDKAEYKKRERVTMELSVSGAEQTPIVGAFSVSVTNTDKVATSEDEQQTIQSDLLLSSDLKGHIENPNYYFNPTNADRNKHLDLLLLSQGWSRFNWKQVQSNTFPELHYKPEQSISVSGRIVSSLANKPIANAKLILLAPSVLYTLDTLSDKNGHFRFEDVNLDEGINFIIKAKNGKDKDNIRIIMDEQETSLPKTSAFPKAGAADTSFVTYLKSTQSRFEEMQKFGLINRTGISLKEVNIVQKRNPAIPYSILKDEINIPDITITAEQMKDKSDLLSLLSGKLGRLMVKNNKIYGINMTPNPFEPKPKNESNLEPKPVLVLLDGQVLDDLTQVSPLSLSGIQIYLGGPISDMFGYLYGKMQPAAHYGILILTTGRTTTPKVQPGLKQLVSRGYSVSKEFYSPSYEVESQQDKMLDLRSTIYWNANLVTDIQGKTSFSFYTADEPGTYRATLEGMDTNGHLVRKVYQFKVL